MGTPWSQDAHIREALLYSHIYIFHNVLFSYNNVHQLRTAQCSSGNNAAVIKSSCNPFHFANKTRIAESFSKNQGKYDSYYVVFIQVSYVMSSFA